MVHFLTGEKWKEIKPGIRTKFRYAVSNFGRVLSFTDKIKNGTLVKGSLVEGYRTMEFKIRKNKKTSYKRIFIQKLVAEKFVAKKSKKQTFVIHLDFNKDNNHYSNLRWATRQKLVEHHKKNPNVIKGIKKTIATKRGWGHKLTTAKVADIKKKIFNPRRKTKMHKIAKQYGISEMQLYRIKSGENWAHVKVGGN